jgi:uncharacterized membrane protein
MDTPGRVALRFKIHWHVLLIHFPISLFAGAFGFQILHLFIAPASFELATNVTLLGGTIMMIPTTLTGWLTWKKNYKGAKIMLFKRKIGAAFAMLAISIPLVTWRFVFLGFFMQAQQSPAHWIYLAGNFLLILGAIIEGYYGGFLHHR